MDRLLVLGMAVLVLGVVCDEAVTAYMVGVPAFTQQVQAGSGRIVWYRRLESNQFAAWHTPLWVVSDVLLTVGLLSLGYLSAWSRDRRLIVFASFVLVLVGVLRLGGAASWAARPIG
jgi:hypothetical protein